MNHDLLDQMDLPPANTRRWIARRKALVVEAVEKGALNIEEACEIYQISLEEFASWQNQMDKHGPDGLRITRINLYR